MQSRTRQEKGQQVIIDVYNLPVHYNKDQIVFYLWKALDKARGLKKNTNPIIKSEFIEEEGCIRLVLRSTEEALNLLDLNGIYYGERAFYMKSELPSRDTPFIEPKNVRIRKVGRQVKEGFNKVYVGNLPPMKDFEILELLTEYGQLKAFEPKAATKAYSQCYCEFATVEQTDNCIHRLNSLKLKGRSIIAKRAALMSSSSKATVTRPVLTKVNLFEKDLSSFYVTLDTVGLFKNMKISCVLVLRNVVTSLSERDFVVNDIRRQLQKIGTVIKVVSRDRNVYAEYQKVQYAQIAYLILIHKKYDNRSVEVSFYDPISFADDFLE